MRFLLLLSLIQYVCSFSRRQLIVGGKEAMGSAAYFASISTMGNQFCGASIISERWVITAAHCVDPENVNEQLYVLAGSNMRYSMHTRIAVSRVVLHPKWDLNEGLNDIALVELQQPLPIETNIIETIKISLNTPLADSWASVLGHGAIYDADLYGSHQLLEADLQIGTYSECVAAYDGNPLPGVICGGGEQAHANTCYGDSGGPLLQPSTEGGVPALVGIVSFGSGPCEDLGSWSYFTNVADFVDWISAVSGLDFRKITTTLMPSTEPYHVIGFDAIGHAPLFYNQDHDKSSVYINPPPTLSSSSFAFEQEQSILNSIEALPPSPPLIIIRDENQTDLVPTEPSSSLAFGAFGVVGDILVSEEALEAVAMYETETQDQHTDVPSFVGGAAVHYAYLRSEFGVEMKGADTSLFASPPPPPSTVSSCVRRCGVQPSIEDHSKYTCFCDATCTRNGDCCEDFESLCKASCQNMCGKFPGHCYCDSSCLENGDCCLDFESECVF